MPVFHIESWAAVAPGITTQHAWKAWFDQPGPISPEFEKVSLKSVKPMLRRRFGDIGQYAMAAVLDVAEGRDSMPCVFASRHGDTKLTLSLLETMAADEPLSPTGFSLAVHNAVSGLYSIAVKNRLEITAIAAQQGLSIHALIESVTQLSQSRRVLCVVYDMPLPALYASYTSQEPFPYAIAMILSQEGQDTLRLSQTQGLAIEPGQSKVPTEMTCESLQLIEFLSQNKPSLVQQMNGSSWCLERVSN